jgi:hypothetical protein
MKRLRASRRRRGGAKYPVVFEMLERRQLHLTLFARYANF